ncbi:uncharacterized protein VTP21DRAFT_8730 [Calcarisporiella thermophila]|uniref:uncharacterized protein n=1 Tax=Calcarisporiella thermophila TaxID=911321 RepID=UPI003743C39D
MSDHLEIPQPANEAGENTSKENGSDLGGEGAQEVIESSALEEDAKLQNEVVNVDNFQQGKQASDNTADGLQEGEHIKLSSENTTGTENNVILHEKALEVEEAQHEESPISSEPATLTSITGDHQATVSKEQSELAPATAATENLESNPLNTTQRTLALIKPDAYSVGRKDEILKMIKENGFEIVSEKELTLTLEQTREFYKEHEGKAFYETLTTWMSSAPVYALILEKEDAISSWRALLGPTDSIKARVESPGSIRALFGTDGSQNAGHGSDSEKSALREITIVFPELKSLKKEKEEVQSPKDANEIVENSTKELKRPEEKKCVGGPAGNAKKTSGVLKKTEVKLGDAGKATTKPAAKATSSATAKTTASRPVTSKGGTTSVTSKPSASASPKKPTVPTGPISSVSAPGRVLKKSVVSTTKLNTPSLSSAKKEGATDSVDAKRSSNVGAFRKPSTTSAGAKSPNVRSVSASLMRPTAASAAAAKVPPSTSISTGASRSVSTSARPTAAKTSTAKNPLPTINAAAKPTAGATNIVKKPNKPSSGEPTKPPLQKEQTTKRVSEVKKTVKAADKQVTSGSIPEHKKEGKAVKTEGVKKEPPSKTVSDVKIVVEPPRKEHDEKHVPDTPKSENGESPARPKGNLVKNMVHLFGEEKEN